MLDMLLPVVFLSAPVLAIAVLVVRLRSGKVVTRSRAAWRNGTRKPVGRRLIAVAAGAALCTVGLERLYLATVSNHDILLVTMVLGLFAATGCAALAGLAAAAVSRARGFGAGAVAGLLTLVGIAAGTASAHLPLYAYYLERPDRFPAVADLGEGDLLAPFAVFLAALLGALPWPILGATLGARAETPRHAVRDVWQLLLDLATADLPESRRAWGIALRAELAAIEPRAERRRFALGGAWAALRSGLPGGTWMLAAGIAAVVGGGTLVASRWSLAHGAGGILGFWMTTPSVLLYGAALAAAWRTRSFGSGLRTGALAGLAALLAALAVGIPEAVLWADRQAGYLSTGDAVPPTWESAVRDVLRPEFLLGMLFFWTIGMAGGAALGTAVGHLHARVVRSRQSMRATGT